MDAWTIAPSTVARLRHRAAIAPSWVAVWLLALSLLAGCRVDPNMQLMERDLRLQDQRIFDLEAHLFDCHAVAEAYKRDIAALRERLDEAPGKETDDLGPLDTWDAERRLRPKPPSDIAPPAIDEGDDPASTQQMPSLDSAQPLEDFDPDPPPPFQGPPLDPADEAETGETSIQQSVDPGSEPTSEVLPSPSLTGSGSDVELINLRLAMQYQATEGLPLQVEALVEPRDAESRRVPAAGDVSLMIQAAEGAGQELARWEFEAEHARHLWKKSRLGTGMQFQLPWPGSPRPGRYRLWVRYVGDDGRKHLGSVDFDVDAAALARRPERPASPRNEPISDGPLLVKSDGDEEAPPKRGARTTDIAWRPSVAAAGLSRREQRPPIATTPIDSTQTASSAPAASVPWSPERPTLETGGHVETAALQPEWSPYR